MQEHKRSKGARHDPEGQVLASMILAQHTNANQRPVYGMRLHGKFWHFAVPNGKSYRLSQAFDATQTDDLERIVATLRNLKNVVL